MLFLRQKLFFPRTIQFKKEIFVSFVTATKEKHNTSISNSIIKKRHANFHAYLPMLKGRTYILIQAKREWIVKRIGRRSNPLNETPPLSRAIYIPSHLKRASCTYLHTNAYAEWRIPKEKEREDLIYSFPRFELNGSALKHIFLYCARIHTSRRLSPSSIFLSLIADFIDISRAAYVFGNSYVDCNKTLATLALMNVPYLSDLHLTNHNNFYPTFNEKKNYYSATPLSADKKHNP